MTTMIATRLLVVGALFCTANAYADAADACYSLLAPDYGISIAGVYRPANGMFAEAEGSGGVSPLKAVRELRTLEAT
jgi:hypothetical protein